MKKTYFVLILLLTITVAVKAQQKQIDSLKAVIKTLPNDTTKVKALFSLAKIYQYFKPDTAIIIGNDAYNIALTIKNEKWQAQCLNLLAITYVNLAEYGKAIQDFFKDLDIYEKLNDEYGTIRTNNNIGSTYNQRGEYNQALVFLNNARKQYNAYKAGHTKIERKYDQIYAYILENIGESYELLHQPDQALPYFNEATTLARAANLHDLDVGFQIDFGAVEAEKNHKNAALKYFNQALKLAAPQNDVGNIDFAYFSMAKLFHKSHQTDSAIFYAEKELASTRKGNFLQDVLDASRLLSNLYDEKQNIPQAYTYYKLATKVSDSLFSQEKVRELVSIDFVEQQHKSEIAAAKLEYVNKVRTYLFIGGFAVVLLLAFIFWRNSRQRKKANELLSEQKEEIEATLTQLSATQTQLIQSEKMASLGELTAGIAHEIQNPLNFVNNFSDVNTEMIYELEAELKSGNVNEALSIANEIRENEKKINHHGRRADFIVKGMLQHSRTSTGERQLTNLNVLADEFLKLSYHGLRAKDKNFNAELVTNFDPNLPKVNMSQQDIGRVLLNLFNNAFYAVNQKAKTSDNNYKPEVTVSTQSANGQVIITVKDNGIGMPEHIKEKIMQPFFTTKPTGEGTGLGLSLSYDIVVKGHGGSIVVNSTQNNGAEFIIQLPLA